MAKILIADDEKEIIKLLKIYLEAEDIRVLEANDGKQAIEIISHEEIDLALVDIMMPKIDGYGVIKHIREQVDRYIPIIVISAKVTLSDRVLGIDLGADDYIVKPFEPLEVAAKVKAQLRRLKHMQAKTKEINEIVVGDISLDLNECILHKDGDSISLTKAEFMVLQLLMSSPRRGDYRSCR